VGTTVNERHLFFSTMYSKGLAGETETFLRYGATPRLAVGAGFLHKQGIVRPLLSYTLVPEAAARPSLTAGLMYDALGGGRQGVFVSAAKDLQGWTGVPASLYVGTARISNERRFRLLGGANFRVSPRLNASVQFDGRYANVGVTARIGSVNGVPFRIGIVAAKGDRFGPLIASDIPIRR
jgi:hypothetical protein